MRWLFYFIFSPLACLERCVKKHLNPLTAEWALKALIDFTLSNAGRFYLSMGNPLDGKGLTTPIEQETQYVHIISFTFGSVKLHILESSSFRE